MKRGILFLKIMASILSAAVIIVLLLFGDNIPAWLGKIKEPAAITQEQTTESPDVTAEPEANRTEAADQITEAVTEPESQNSEETEGTVSEETTVAEEETEASTVSVGSVSAVVLPENAEDPYLSSPLESIVVKENELEDLVVILLESGELIANDGMGKIRAEQIKYELDQMYQDAEGNLTTDSSHTLKKGFYSVVFTLTDDWNRKKQHTMILVVAEEVNGPILTLNARKVTLKSGESFQYLKYIDMASDPVDGNISERIQLEGSVDTSVPGQYQVKFFARNLNGVRSPKATLLVTVE